MRKLYEQDPDAHRRILLHISSNNGITGHLTGGLKPGGSPWLYNVLSRSSILRSNALELGSYVEQYGTTLYNITTHAWQNTRLSNFCESLPPATLNSISPLSRITLNNTRIMLCGAGRLHGACVTKAEAVTIQQQLYEKNPDKHRAQLASYLEQHSITAHIAG